jgi:hypothetical protein
MIISKSFGVAMNGSAIDLTVGGLHWCDQSLDGSVLSPARRNLKKF